MWVNDFHNDRFVRFDRAGRFLDQWPSASERPLGFVVAPDGSLYISDAQYEAPAIVHHGPDGQLLARWPVAGTSRDGTVGGVRGPVDLELAPDGSLVALVYRAEDMIQRFDGATGERLAAWAPEVEGAVLARPQRRGGRCSGHRARAARGRPAHRPLLTGRHVVGGAARTTRPRRSGGCRRRKVWPPTGAGGLLVADAGNDRIQRFDAAGRFMGQYGGLASPADVAVAADSERVVIADTGNDRVLQLDAQGALVRAWGGAGEGHFAAPEGVALGSDGRIFVADTGHDRVQVIEADGRLGPAWGERGGLPGQLDRPRGIAVDAAGDVRVVDAGNHRVQVFAPDGRLRYVLGFHGAGDGQFRSAQGLAVDAAAGTWVTDPLLHRVQRFDWAGRALMGWGFRGWRSSEIGRMEVPSGVAADAAGGIWVADAALDRIQRFDARGRVDRVLGSPIGTGGWRDFLAEGDFDDVRDIVVDPNGELLLIGRWPSGRVQRLAADGSYRGSWSLIGRQDHAMNGPVDFAVGSHGLLHVLEFYNDVQRIAQYDRDGAWSGEWDLAFAGQARSGQIDVGQDGAVYVLLRGDGGASRVQIYRPDGSLQATWRPRSAGYPSHSGIAVAPDGEVFLTRDFAIERYGLDGALLGSFGERGRGPGQFQGECIGCGLQLEIDAAGLLYVGDYGNQRIHRFTREGRFLDAWGPEYRTEIPPWDFPGVFALAPDGRVFTYNTLAGLRVYGAEAPEAWRASFHGNRWLAERPLRVETIEGEGLALTWQEDPTGPWSTPDGFSARFERWLSLPPGPHTLALRATGGGVRLRWGDRLLVDAWEHASVERSVTVEAGVAVGKVVVEYNASKLPAAIDVRFRPAD